MEIAKSENFVEILEKLIISTKAFEYHEKEIRLAYGEPSHYYFDFRRLTGDSKGINTTANILYNMIQEIGHVKSVGGLELGSIPLSTAISHLSYIKNPDKPINSFYVRKKPKMNGLTKTIEGCIKSPAVVVDDVITTETSAIKAIKEVRNAGKTVDHLLSIVFRGTEEEKKKIERENKIRFHYVFHQDQFIKKYEQEHPEVVVNI